MKPFKTIFLSVLVLAFALSNCTETADPEVFYNISGTVTYPDGNADGALVYLVIGSTPSTNYSQVTVADESGAYSFKTLSAGDYFLFSDYNTANTNNAGGRLDGIRFSSDDSNVVSIVNSNVTANIALVNNGPSGVVINTVDVDPNTELTPYRFDKSHSEMVFEFPFDEGNATFSGRFDTYDAMIDFDDNDLANSSITASVDLLTVKTGQPGRDGLWTTRSSVDGVDSVDNNQNRVTWFDAGCLTGYLGAADGSHFNTVLIPEAQFATFTSSGIELFGDGYKASGTMELKGATSNVDVYFKFIPGFINNSGKNYASFEVMFVFDPANDHGVTSSHLLDKVTVYASIQLREN